MFRTLIAALSLTAACYAAPIMGITVTSTAPDFADADPIAKTVDYSNLSGSTFADVTTNGFGWFSDGNVVTLPFTITYNLNGLFDIGQLALWNAATPTNPEGPQENNEYGFLDVLIETSANGLAYTAVSGATLTAGVHSFAQADDASGNKAEIVNFNPVTAAFVRFTVISAQNGSPNYAGYQAVGFDGIASATPELNGSASLPFCAVACMCLMTLGRRKSAATA